MIGGSFYYGNEIPALKNKYFFADWHGSLFALSKNKDSVWKSQPFKIINKPTQDFFICGCYIDVHNQIYLMGYLADKTGEKGVIYKIEKA